MDNDNPGKDLQLIEKYWRHVSSSQGFKYFPLVVSRAKASKVWDINGREYIDFLSSAATYNIGHSNEEVIKAIKEHLDKFIHYCLYLYHEPAIELSELLTEITLGNHRKKVVFGLSGGDANDTALKAAFIYTRRPGVISYTYSYHGTTALGIAVGGSFREEIRKAIPFKDVYFVEYPDTYRCGNIEDPRECGEYHLSKLEDTLKRVNPSSIAAIIMEPIQGDGGVLVPPENYVKGLFKLARENGIIIIDDEVQTGMGRTGKWLAIEHFNVEPDLVVLGKALGGGMPISAVIGRSEILDAAPPQTFFATSAAHALSCVAAIATIKYIKNYNLVEKARELGDYAVKRLNELKEKYEIIGDVRGKGLMIGVEIVKERKQKTPDRKTALKIIWRAWEKGLIMMTYGKYGNVLRIAPPLVISREELDAGINIVDEAIRDVLEGKVPDDVINKMKAWE
ncbi:aspartate aminotransferase family protein [Desulfurococcus amylolyticus]|uniref:Aminotransferase class-III n=1 Tax=Desulfurococcus amylolyticus DSM 16532 TaxID=768672 RepID=I3XPP5_DESAM|nr:aspartate aminotransferase family protein [Desulfurococcus amylolyticus]AFL65919.1 aminotransferase class-III [Desulfurococcus amylolyticus DSM 16532]